MLTSTPLLRIGEAARLLGITPKTLRHYERQGLLGAPIRGPNGYRLYTPADLLYVQRIRRLQALGLSLHRIAAVLGQPDDRRTLRQALAGLLAETEQRICQLEDQRTHIQRLLAQPHEQLDTAPPSSTLAALRARLEPHHLPISERLWAQEERIWSTLDTLNWPGREQLHHAAHRFAVFAEHHPDDFARLLVLAERVAALASGEPADAEIAHLAQALRTDPALALLRSLQQPAELGDSPGMVEALWAMAVDDLTPAQRRLFELLATADGVDDEAGDAHA